MWVWQMTNLYEESPVSWLSRWSYCWWKKSCTTWHVWNPVKNWIFTWYLSYQLVQDFFQQHFRQHFINQQFWVFFPSHWTLTNDASRKKHDKHSCSFKNLLIIRGGKELPINLRFIVVELVCILAGFLFAAPPTLSAVCHLSFSFLASDDLR